MATIAEIVRNGHGRAGSHGAWQVSEAPRTDGAGRGHQDWRLWHYTTAMLQWTRRPCGKADVIFFSLGRRTVSDQQGMNAAFEALGLPLYYARDRAGGGPRIEPRP